MDKYPHTVLTLCQQCNCNMVPINKGTVCTVCTLLKIIKEREPEKEQKLYSLFICECCSAVYTANEKIECSAADCPEMACDTCGFCSYECCNDRRLNMRLVVLKESVRQIEAELTNRVESVVEGDRSDSESDDSFESELEDDPTNTEEDKFDVKKEIEQIKDSVGMLFKIFLSTLDDDHHVIKRVDELLEKLKNGELEDSDDECDPKTK